jgi:DNA-binding NarL/FixJ family response regulator
MPRILIADDHPLFRAALAQQVREVAADVQVDEAHSLASAQAALEHHPDTDLVLLDLHMPGSHGLMGLATLRAEHPTVAVLMVSAHEDPAVVRRALAYGAAGFLSKSVDATQIREAVRAVLDCREWVSPALRHAVDAEPLSATDRELGARFAALTPQQFRVLRRVAEGRLNKQIADELGVQERTIKAHRHRVMEKLQVQSLAELVSLAERAGILKDLSGARQTN